MNHPLQNANRMHSKEPQRKKKHLSPQSWLSSHNNLTPLPPSFNTWELYPSIPFQVPFSVAVTSLTEIPAMLKTVTSSSSSLICCPLAFCPSSTS